MKRMFRFQKQYFILALIILIVEILIAVYVHDRIVRPYVGDFLVVILLYCFIRAFLDSSILATALSVLLFSYIIEILQYFNLVDILGLHNSKLAKILLGSSFEWIDLIVYTAGIATVLCIEKLSAEKDSKTKN